MNRLNKKTIAMWLALFISGAISAMAQPVVVPLLDVTVNTSLCQPEIVQLGDIEAAAADEELCDGSTIEYRVTGVIQAGQPINIGPFNGDADIPLGSDTLIYIPSNCCFRGVDTVGVFVACVDLSTTPVTTNSVHYGAVRFIYEEIPPIAYDDTYQTDEDLALNVDAASGILTNDEFSACFEFVIELIDDVDNGILDLNSTDGSFAYTPDPDYCGTDAFVYRLVDSNDPSRTSNYATVYINVYAVNDAPVAVDDIYTTGIGVPLDVAAAGVLTNDYDVDAINECGEYDLTAVLVNDVTYGALTLNADGSFLYTPAGDFCRDTFTYYTTDGVDDSNIATVTINISGYNSCPYTNDTENLKVTVYEDDTYPVTKVFSYQELVLDRFEDDDIGTECGSTNLGYEVATDLNPPPEIVLATIRANDNSLELRISSNIWNAVEQCYAPCEEFFILPVYYRVFDDSGECLPGAARSIDIYGVTVDDAPVAPLVEVPGDGCITEDSQNVEISIGKILGAAAYANPDNCCESYSVEEIGCCWQLVCQDDGHVENQIVDFWPENDFELEIDGEIVSFTGTLAEVTTAKGGTATLDGSVIRYTPPANWPLCDMDYDYIPYIIRQTTTYGEDCTTEQLTSTGLIKVAVCKSCDDPVAVNDEVNTCEETIAPISLQDLVSNDYDIDFSPSNIVAYTGTDDIGIELLGNEPIPESIGGFTLVPFDVDVQAAYADFDTSYYIPSGSCIQGGLQSSIELSKRTTPVDGSWATWSHGYTGPVWSAQGEVEAVLTLPTNTTAFAFHINPSSNTDEYTIYVEANDGSVSDVAALSGYDTAGVAFYAQSPGKILKKIYILASDSTSGFAIGEFAISQQPIAYVCNVGVAMGPSNGELIIDSYLSPVGAIATSLQYRPNPNFFGTDTFSYQYCIIDDCHEYDNDPESSTVNGNTPYKWVTGYVTVNVAPVSDIAPEANDDSFEGLEDTVAMIDPADLLANDSDGGDKPLNANNESAENLCIVEWDSQSVNGGTVELIDGMIYYTPAANFNGMDSFTYTISDQYGEDCTAVSECNEGNEVTRYSTATVSINVLPVNDSPDIEDAGYTMLEDGVLTGDLNDYVTDVEVELGTCSTLTFRIGTESVNNGTLMLNANGTFSYKPATNWFGTDAFAFYVVDCGDNGAPVLTSVVAIVTLQVDSVNDLPIAHAKSATVLEDTSVAITLTGTDVDGVVVSGSYNQPANGTVSGVYPNVIYTPYANFEGTDSFTYTVTDNDGGVSAPATVTITVIAVNDCPTASPVAAATTQSDPVVINLSGSDVDVGDELNYNIVSQPANGTLSGFAPNSSQVTYTPRVGFIGTDSFTYRVDDGKCASATRTVTVTVNPNAYVQGDWNGDGRADLGIYDNGVFYGNWFGKTSSGGQNYNWGYPGVMQVPGDYNGDGKLDGAVYDPATSMWYIRLSSGNKNVQFGFAGCVPVQADYDGDGVTDIAVFHKASATWFAMRSTAGFVMQQFGWPGVKPVPADYDGDGRADIVVYDPAAANWYFLLSDGGYAGVVQFGYPGVIPVPADYDGDGKADGAVYDPTNGNWFLRRSSAGFLGPVQFGFPGVIPVPADYDGDGSADGAVYHPAGGNWYLLKSTEGFSVENFGGPQFLPITSVPGIWSFTP